MRLYRSEYERRALETWRILEQAVHEPWQTFDAGEVHNRQHGRCYLCGGVFVARKNDPLEMSRDHVFPRSRGGQNLANLLLAHRRCNVEKKNDWPTPCQVLYLFAIYAAPLDPMAPRVLANHARMRRAERRRAVIARNV